MPRTTRKEATQAQNLIKALSYPLRAEIFRIISERGKISPKEIAKELDEGLPTVSHHVRVLAELNCIEGVDQVPRRGAIEHFYVATSKPWIDTADWDAMPKTVRNGFLGEIVELFLGDCVAALKEGSIGEDANFVLARDRLMVDEEGLTEGREIVDRALQELADVEARSSERLAESGETGLTVALAQAWFRLP